MKKLLLIASLVALSSAAQADQNYLKAFDVGVCSDANLYQRTAFVRGVKVAVVPLIDTNPALVRACLSNMVGGAGENSAK